MSARRSRWPGAVSALVAAAALVGPALGFRIQTVLTDIALLAEPVSGYDVGWIVGGTGIPQPDDFFIWGVNDRYFSGPDLAGLSTPEQFCPIVCLQPFLGPGDLHLPPDLDPNDFQPFPPNLTFGSSVFTGAGILDHAIRPPLTAGDDVAVFGYSQSAVVATATMQHLLENPPADPLYDPSNLQVVLIGNPNDPLSGILTRLQFSDGIEAFSLNPAPQHVPFLNIPLSIGPTPTEFATDIYTAEYDGWANFPRDPTNLLADVNAIAGILTAHGNYPFFNPDVELADAVHIGAIDNTNLYIIPTEQLPILWPIYQLGDFGRVAGAALEPGLRLGIDWGYGNPGDLAVSQIFAADGAQVVGPWAVNASGEIATGSGLAGFIPMMDPLQMFAGIQDAGVHTVLDPLNEILGLAGLGQVPGWLDDALHLTYDLTNSLDQLLLTGWSDLATALNLLDVLGPDAVFSGLPLISGQPVLDLIGLGFDLFNFFGA